MVLKIQKSFKTIYLIGEEADVESILFDLQGFEWYIFNIEKVGNSQVRVTLLQIIDKK